MFPYNLAKEAFDASKESVVIKHPHLVRHIVETMEEWYGILLSAAQADAIIQWNAGLEADLERNGLDTGSREWFLGELTRRVGMKVAWPTGGDSDAYAIAFFMTFKRKALENGVRLSSTFLQDKGV